MRILLAERGNAKRIRRIRKRKRGRDKNVHWHPLMRMLKKKMSQRRIYNPATSRRISLWTFRHPITERVKRQIGRHRTRMYIRFHHMFLKEANRILVKYKRKPSLKGLT